MVETDSKKIEIQDLTKVGHGYLSSGSTTEACETFLEVYQIARQMGNDFILRGCAFNLGACYVACGKIKIGLKYLEQSIPPQDDDDGDENFADLWYNIGVAKHALNEIDESVVAYKKACDTYEAMGTRRLQAECLSKLAVCYHLKDKLKDSHEMYKQAQKIFRELNDKNSEALCLVSATGVLSQIGDITECAKTLDILLDVCQEIEDKHLQAKIYHDIGLLYISEKLYDSAAECFEQSFTCIKESDKNDELLRATVLQNMGAVCNFMKMYEKAIFFHRESADSYGAIGDRKAQTNVFNNLAYAYTQIENYPGAITAFQHSIQAAKDTGDKESQCLATEGIAAIWFRLKQFKKAVLCYKEALRLISLHNINKSHADRVVDKLADAIENEFKSEKQNYKGKITRKTRDDFRRFSQGDQLVPLVARGLGDNSAESSTMVDKSTDERSEDEDVQRKKHHSVHDVLASENSPLKELLVVANPEVSNEPSPSDIPIIKAEEEQYISPVTPKEPGKGIDGKQSNVCVVM